MIGALFVGLAFVIGLALGFAFGFGIIANPWIQECYYFCPDGTEISAYCWKGANSESQCVDSLSRRCSSPPVS
jgi:hypothetical protein